VTQRLVILDNSCYAKLVDSQAKRRFYANLRAAGLSPAASVINLLEAVPASPPSVHEQLISLIREIAGGSLLVWPFELLQRLGRAMIEGQQLVVIEQSGAEWYLDDAAARVALREECRVFNADLERHFSNLHEKVRKSVQRHLKKQGARPSRADGRAFLVEQWRGSEWYTDFAMATWKALGLPGSAPLSQLAGSEPWSLLLDAEGLATFNRVIAHAQPPRVQRMDFLQLVYLGSEGRGILATADEPFREFADTIVTGRYPGTRVVHIDVLLSGA
jgi:hypothetical protein